MLTNLYSLLLIHYLFLKASIFNGLEEITSPILPSLDICIDPYVNDKTPALPVDKVKPFLSGTTNSSLD